MKETRVYAYEETFCFGQRFRYYAYDASTGKLVDVYDALAADSKSARKEFREYAKELYKVLRISK